MKAVCWFGTRDVRVRDVPEPRILNPRDAIVKVTSTAICGSDLHLYNGYIPTMRKGDILGHEFMGTIEEVGPAVKNLKRGDRVVVPFAICCGGCFFCANGMWSQCDNSNPNSQAAQSRWGYSGAGLFGYSHLLGGYAGGQAEYVRVPYADVGPLVIPHGVPDDRVLFLSDILPTAYMAVEQGMVKPGDVVAVWGCGPVGLLAMICATQAGAHQVIGIDHLPVRLEMARTFAGADTLDFDHTNVVAELKNMTGGRGPDVCIDAVGLESTGHGAGAVYDRIKHKTRLEHDRPTAIRQIIQACRKGGAVSIPGVYGGMIDKFPMGAVFGKGLTLKGGQTHVQAYMQPLLQRILSEELDPSFVITHKLPLTEAPRAYATFNEKREDCVKVVLKAA